VNLIVDIGNSFTKVAIFSGDTLVKHYLHEAFSNEDLTPYMDEYGIDKAIISSVSQDAAKVAEHLEKKKCKSITLSSATALPFHVQYQTPKTLGSDRIAAVAGGQHLFPGQPVLIIEAGTCVTYDITTEKGSYLGGAISPGLKMRYKAMHEFTKNLPLLEPVAAAELTGTSTAASIHSGALNGLINEMDGMIDKFKEMYPHLRIIISGGDINYFDKKLKNNIFARPNIVLIGLNQILKYNFEN